MGESGSEFFPHCLYFVLDASPPLQQQLLRTVERLYSWRPLTSQQQPWAVEDDGADGAVLGLLYVGGADKAWVGKWI